MNIEDFTESVEFATKILQFVKDKKPSNMAVSYVAFIYIVCTHALSMNNIELSLNNMIKLLDKINNAIKTEVEQMISERNGNGQSIPN
jgi:hypothetical protein